MEILEAMRRKRAVREYAETRIPEKVIYAILSAGRRAQSSRNLQSWRLIVLRNKDRLEILSKAGNHAAHLAKAALGIVIATPDPTENVSILFDAGQAAAYMQLAALESGIGSCLVKLHNKEYANSILCLPPDYQVNFAIAFGYLADPSSLSPDLMRNGREKLTNLVYWEQWYERSDQ